MTTVTRPIGIGVVGAGSIGIRGVLDHLCLPDVQDRLFLAAVCDPSPGRAEAAGEKYGVRRAYESYDDLLADDAVDAVTICSPIGLHYDQGMAALRAGKHIHFNKTMTVTSAEATEIIDEATARNLKIVASPGQMLRIPNLRFRKLIQDGALGKLSWAVTGAAFGSYHEKESVRGGSDPLTNINPSWYWRKPGGGPLYDMTVYGLHTLTGILGPVKRVTAMSGIAVTEREFQGQSYPTDADDNSLILLDFGDSVFALAHGTVAGGVSEFGQPSIFGTKGTIVGFKLNGEPLDYPGRTEGVSPIQQLPHVRDTPHATMQEAHVFEDLMQLVDLVRDGTPTNATPEHARHVIEIIEAGLRAAESSVTQELTTAFTPPEGV